MKVFSGIASCRRMRRNSSAAMNRNPPEPTMRILAMSLWSALVTIRPKPDCRLGKPSTAISGRGFSIVLIRSALLTADDVFDHVGRDVGNFFFAQGPTKGGHSATPVGDLFFGAGLFFGFRHRRQVGAAVAAVAGGPVADRAFFGEDFFTGFGVRSARRAGFFATFFSSGFFAGACFFGRFGFFRFGFARFFGFRSFDFFGFFGAFGFFFGTDQFFAFGARGFAVGFRFFGFEFGEFFVLLRLDLLRGFLAGFDPLLLFDDEFFEPFGAHHFDRGAHRRVALAREGRGLTEEFTFGVGAEDHVIDLAGDRVGLRRQVGDAPRMDDVGRFEVEFDRRVRRDHKFVIGEGAVRIVVAPEPLLTRRVDDQRSFELFAFEGGEAGGGGLRRRGRVAGEDDAQHEEQDREAHEAAADAQLDAPGGAGRTRRAAAAGAETTDHSEQAEVDRDEDDQRGEEADPNQSVYLAGARRVRRQGAAILITASGVDAVRPARPACRPTYTRRRDEQAFAAIRSDTTGRPGRGGGHVGRRDRPSPGAKAPQCPEPSDARGELRRAPRRRRPRAAHTQTRRRPLRDADVGVHGGPRDALRRPGGSAPPALHPLPDQDGRTDRARAPPRLPPADDARRPAPLRRARPLPDDHPLALVLRALRGPLLDPRPPPRPLPPRRPPAGGGLRRRRPHLLGGADRASVVGLRAGPDQGTDAADHVRGRRAALGPLLGSALQSARRQSLGGNALAPLRHLGGRREIALGSEQARGRGRLGLRADPRLRPRLPRRALRHRPARRCRAGRRRAPRRSRLRPRGRRGLEPPPATRVGRRRRLPLASPARCRTERTADLLHP